MVSNAQATQEARQGDAGWGSGGDRGFRKICPHVSPSAGLYQCPGALLSGPAPPVWMGNWRACVWLNWLLVSTGWGKGQRGLEVSSPYRMEGDRDRDGGGRLETGERKRWGDRE